MTIAPLDLILLLGSLQGFILATLLWVNTRGHRLSNRLLAALIGLMALMSLSVGMPITHRWVGFALEMLPFIMVMPLGPLIYFYARSVLDPTFRLGINERRQFYPVVLDWGSRFVGWFFVGGLLLGFFRQEQGSAFGAVMDGYNTYVDIPRWISVMVYLLITRHYLIRQQFKSVNGRQQDWRWLRQFVTVFLVFQAIWLVHLVPYIMPDLRGPLLDKFGWYPIYIPITFLIYWLGLKGYLHTRTNVAALEKPKTSATYVPDETVEKTVGLLTGAMQQDRVYLDPELTVEKVARHVQLPQKTVSFVLNQHLRKSFSTFVNEYRIEAVKSQLTNPANEHLTLTGIAFECGFNSQATFQRAFRQATGRSPKEYLSQQAAES